MSTMSNLSMAYQAKVYNEVFAFKSSVWKLQKWLNQFRGKSASPSPSSTISRSSNNMNRNKRKQETENNFRSIIEELSTMIGSHVRKYKIIIRRLGKKPNKYYALSRELRNIGENLNLSVDDETDEEKAITKITLGSKHELSQFTLEIGFDTDSCDILPNECALDVTLCEKDAHKDDNFVDLLFSMHDTNTIINDLISLIDDGDFDTLSNKLLLIRYFDDFHNYFPTLLLSNLVYISNGVGDGDANASIHKQIELCLKALPNIMQYKRLLDGPTVIYAQQIMDCILSKIKPPTVWKLSFVGLYPQNPNNYNIINKAMTIKAIIKMKGNGNENENENININKEHLLYWFVLNPSIIVPVETAKQLFADCLGEIGHKVTNFNKMKEFEKEGSESSSWIIDETYCYHNMLVGEYKKRKAIEIFENEYQYFQSKNSHFTGNGVKIDQFAIYDLNYSNADNMDKSTLFAVINELKNWVIINQIYCQCFEQNNYKKWKINADDVDSKMEKISHKFEINIRDSNHLQVAHLANNDSDIDEDNELKMDVDAVAVGEGQYKLPPNVNEWMAHFCIDNDHNINVQVKYWIVDRDKNRSKPLGMDMIYEKKISAILQKTNSVPITLSYISQLFDGRYLKQKLKIDTKQAMDTDNNENDDNTIDID